MASDRSIFPKDFVDSDFLVFEGEETSILYKRTYQMITLLPFCIWRLGIGNVRLQYIVDRFSPFFFRQSYNYDGIMLWERL